MALFQYRDGKEGGWWVEDKWECAWVTDKAILRREGVWGWGTSGLPTGDGRGNIEWILGPGCFEWATMVVAAISIT